MLPPFHRHLFRNRHHLQTYLSGGCLPDAQDLRFELHLLEHEEDVRRPEHVLDHAQRHWLKKFDHCAIYLLIAGTYTPFLLVGLNSPLAKGLMAVIWGLALLGVLFKLAFAHRFEALSLVTYLTMGWLSLIVIYQLVTRLEAGGVTLLAIGGVVYTLGVIFYASKRIRFGHAIWHAFVLGGSACHFMAIYLYV